MTSSSNPRIRVLSDKVAETDELGSHDLIANFLQDLIDSEEDGKSIALTGPWGSGKSSVIRMLQNKLGASCCLFLYDAWAHERDPLHRSLLEKLGDYLSGLKWIPPAEWKEEREKLAKRRETTEITHHRRPTWLGYFLSILALLVPLGLILLNQKPWDELDSISLRWGLILTLAPIGIALLSFALSFVPSSEKWKMQLRYVLSTDSREDYKSDTYRTIDPTVIEFQELYKQLLSECLHDTQRKLIVVIDNLDRLDVSNALSMWSSMKTLLDHSLLEGEDWSCRVWLIVPFDPTAMKRLWDGDAPERKGHGNLGESFIDKTFQVTFHVPPPVLSNWIDYFKRQLKHALPDVDSEDEIHAVYRVFRLKRFSGVSSPTPREIKIFINRIGAIYRQWHADITLRVIALYATVEDNDNLISLLQAEDKSIAGPLSAQFFGNDHVLQLAAIHFNVSTDDAAQVLLGPKLEKYILEKDVESFARMSQMNGSAGVLEEIVETNILDWAKENPSVISWLANHVNEGQDQRQSYKTTWSHLCEGAREVDSWKSIDSDTGSGLSKLIDHVGSVEFAKKMLGSISKTEPQPTEEDQALDAPTIDAWLQGCTVVLERITEVFGIEIIQEHFRCPGEAQTYISIMIQANELDTKSLVVENMRPATSAKSVVGAVTKSVTAGEYSESLSSVVRNLIDMQVECPWSELVAALSARAKAPNNLEPDEVAALLETLNDLESLSDEASAALSTLATGPDIFHHLHATHGKQHPRSTALCLFLILKNNIGGVPPQPAGNSVSGAQVFKTTKSTPTHSEYALEELLGIIIEHDDVELVFGPLTGEESIRPLGLELIRRLSSREDLLSIVSAENFVKHEADIYTALHGEDEAYQITVDKFVKDAGLEDTIENLGFNPEIASLYRAVLLSTHSSTDVYRMWLVTKLKQVTEDQWISELEADYDNLFDLLVALRSQDVAIGLSVDFRNTLTKYCDKINAGSQPKADLSKIWQKMLECLDENYRKQFISNTIDKIIEADTSHAEMITLFGPALLDCERLDIAKDDLIRKGFSRFVENSRMEELSWFSLVLQECPDVIKKCRKENRTTLKGDIKHLLAKHDIDDGVRTVLIEIAQTIGVPVVSDKTDDSDN